MSKIHKLSNVIRTCIDTYIDGIIKAGVPKEVASFLGGFGTAIANGEFDTHRSDLEINGLVKRSVFDTRPVTVKYELTDYGCTIMPIIDEIANWGGKHRLKILHG